VPSLCGFYPDVCLTTEEKAPKKKTSDRVAIHKHTIRIHSHNNKNDHNNKKFQEFILIKLVRALLTRFGLYM